MLQVKFGCMRIESKPIDGGPGSDGLKRALRAAADATCTAFITTVVLHSSDKVDMELLLNWLYYANDSTLHHGGDAAEFSAVVVVAMTDSALTMCNGVVKVGVFAQLKIECAPGPEQSDGVSVSILVAAAAVYLDIPIFVTHTTHLQLKPIGPYFAMDGRTINFMRGDHPVHLSAKWKMTAALQQSGFMLGGKFLHGNYWGAVTHFKALVDSWRESTTLDSLIALCTGQSRPFEKQPYFCFRMDRGEKDAVTSSLDNHPFAGCNNQDGEPVAFLKHDVVLWIVPTGDFIEDAEVQSLPTGKEGRAGQAKKMAQFGLWNPPQSLQPLGQGLSLTAPAPASLTREPLKEGCKRIRVRPSKFDADRSYSDLAEKFALAANATCEGYVTVTIMTGNFACYLDNWLAFIANIPVFSSILVACADRAGLDDCEQLKAHYSGLVMFCAKPAFFSETPITKSDNSGGGNSQYNRLMWGKPDVLAVATHQGIPVFWTDLDVIMLKDPGPYLIWDGRTVQANCEDTQADRPNAGVLFIGGRFVGDGMWDASSMIHFMDVWNSTYHFTKGGAAPYWQNEQGTLEKMAVVFRGGTFDTAHPSHFHSLDANYNFRSLTPAVFRLKSPIGFPRSEFEMSQLSTFHVVQANGAKQQYMLDHKCWRPSLFTEEGLHCKFSYASKKIADSVFAEPSANVCPPFETPEAR